MPTCNIIMSTCDLFLSTCNIIMCTCDLFMSTCNIIMSTCDLVMSTCNIIMFTCGLFINKSHVDINKSHVDIIMLHVGIIYLACRGQKYANIQTCSRLIACIWFLRSAHEVDELDGTNLPPIDQTSALSRLLSNLECLFSSTFRLLYFSLW